MARSELLELRASDRIATPSSGLGQRSVGPGHENAPFRFFNIGNNRPVKLGEYVSAIERVQGMRAIKELLPLQH
jgi:UDP-glucuronate 4-epimerase